MYKTFWIDLTVDNFDYIEDYVKNYKGVEEYLIAHELKNSLGVDKPHFHIVLKIDDIKTINNILKHFKTKFNLKNDTGKRGGKRFYGMLKTPIENPEKLKIYCCKEGNIRSNISDEELKKLESASYLKKSTEKKILEIECREYIEEKHPFGFRRYAKETKLRNEYCYYDTKSLKIEIINFITGIKKIKLTKHQLENYFLQCIQLSENEHIKMKPEEIYQYFYENQPDT